ncbi:MAG: hypothetical protein ACJ76R_07405 [Solirubrobacteraceae bacterium]
MPRLPIRSTGPRRAIRWMEVLAAVQWTYDRAKELWDALDARERDEVRRLLEKSRGRPSNLTQAEQRRLRDLVLKAARNR